jgi:hypothetical protein
MILSPTQNLVHKLYHDRQGEPLTLTPTQDQLFAAVAMKQYHRIHCMCHTRFGKSQVVSLATLTRLTNYPEKWAIIAGQKEKAKIIMDYVITHIFDNDYTKQRFIPDKGETMEEIRRHRNKNHLTFDTGKTLNGKSLLSELTIGSAKDALGYGAENIIEDESALIPDDEHSLVMRMLGDNPHDNFLIKIGNPFTRGHFLDSYHDPKYKKIVADYQTGIREGRLTEQLVEEQRRYIWFPILYECKFPSGKEMDETGYMQLVLDIDLVNAQRRQFQEPVGRPKLGVDVAKGGRNYNCWVLRFDNYAKVLLKNNEENSVKIAEKTLEFMREIGVMAEEVYIDDTGVGHGVTSVLKNRGYEVNAVNFGEGATKVIDDSGQEVPAMLLNVRAECYAGEDGVQAWIKHRGALEPSDEWNELKRVKYRKQPHSGKTQIEPKDQMIKRGVQSPDVADALALTFAKVKKIVYHGINVEQVLASGAVSEFGGVAPYPGMPGWTDEG